MSTANNLKLKTIMNKQSLIVSIMAGFISGFVLFGSLAPNVINADYEKSEAPLNLVKVSKTIQVVVTAYSSTEDQTDSTPFDTASGKKVRDGIIANNMLPFGTKVRIPQLYGDKIFTVEDRMHSRKGKYHIDIWFPEYKQAKQFGAKWNIKIEVLES